VKEHVGVGVCMCVYACVCVFVCGVCVVDERAGVGMGWEWR